MKIIIALVIMLMLTAAECKTDPGTGDNNPRPTCNRGAGECPPATGKQPAQTK